MLVGVGVTEGPDEEDEDVGGATVPPRLYFFKLAAVI